MNDLAYRSSLDLPAPQPPSIGRVIYSFLKTPVKVWSHRIPVVQALLYLFAKTRTCTLTHTYTQMQTHTQKHTHRMLSDLISAPFRTVVECKKLTSDLYHHTSVTSRISSTPSINSSSALLCCLSTVWKNTFLYS